MQSPPERIAAKLSDAPVARWVIFFTGFLQREGGRTGLERLQRRVNAECSGPDNLIVLKSWRDSARDTAQRIANWRDEEADPRVVLVGFSYGGYTANETARELQKHRIAVETLALVDPVPRIFARLPSSTSLLNVWSITVPSNVRRLLTWRQVHNRPGGSKIRLADKITDWQTNETYVDVPHTAIDDLPQIHRAIRLIACPREEAA